MTHKIYEKGNEAKVSVSFVDASGNATDPTVVELKVKKPSGLIIIYVYSLDEVTKSTTGSYYKDLLLDESGVWFYRWEGIGAVNAAGESKFEVAPSEF